MPAPHSAETGLPPRPAGRPGLTWMCAAALVVLTVSVFSWTVKARSHWFGKPAQIEGHWFTWQALVQTSYWYREGFLNLRGTLIKNPPSIEFPTFQSREPYVSHPLGGVLPIYWISLAAGHEPTPEMVMGYNLANHLAIAILMSLGALLLLRGMNVAILPACLLAAIPPLLVLLLPGPAYDLQCVYYGDIGVITWFAATVFLEILRDAPGGPRARRAVAVVQWCVLFLGAYCHSFFLPVAAVLYAKRLLDGGIRRRGVGAFLKSSLAFWSPIAAALVLYLGHIVAIGQVGTLFGRFKAMAGMTPEVTGELWEVNGRSHVATWHEQIWLRFMGERFGPWGIYLFGASAAALLGTGAYALARRVRKKPVSPEVTRVLYLMGLLMLPCVLWFFVLPGYAYDNHNSVLPLTLTIATVPLVLVPLLGVKLAGRADGGPWRVIVPVALGLCGIYLAIMLPHYTDLFPPDSDPSKRMTGGYEKIGGFLRQNARYEDVVFSPIVRILNTDQPQNLFYSRKCVYPLTSLEDVAAKIRPVDDKANVAILLMAMNLNQPLWQVKAAMRQLPFEIVESAPFQIESPYLVPGPDGKPLANQPMTRLILCRIRKDVFLRDYEKLAPLFPLHSPAAPSRQP